jgi:16S rRNA (uracil1498-N3)-methyltransferase
VAKRLAESTGIVLHEAATSPFAQLDLPAEGDIVVVVGPEGGISDDELAVFESSGASVVRLGDSVLRTSTAGPAALAALSLRLGRWA